MQTVLSRSNMNRFEEENFVNVYDLIFKGHELILSGTTIQAIEHYAKVEDAYSRLPDNLKVKLQAYAVNLYRSICNAKTNEEEENFLDNNDLRKFRFKNGTVITSLLQLIYVTESMQQITWQCHVNNSKNEILDWIKYTLNEKKLSNLLEGITDMKSVRDIVFKHLIMSSDEKFSIEESYCNF
jgi:hypothetical protein